MRIEGLPIEGLPIVGLSVIIPALNAAASLPATLAALGDAPAEVLVVDGCSTDATVQAAGTARILHAPRGRGGQLAAGIAAAEGPWLLLLHADTRLAPDWEIAVRAAMADPGRAHHFRFVLDDPSPQARRLERAVAWRSRALGLPYGDQGLLIHKGLLAAVGGMKALPLMEDVDLARRLGRARLAAMPAAAITSAVRWQRDGWWRRSARNLTCLGLFYLGVPPGIIARIYTGRRQG
ncbi:TIGR04283 family arsenosugar biosynthesis glycosyltransferase [Falsiroseomonas frigidaquae]|uniref:TIGR04283 family arsenosugar biosynthesis glycosyltransferase n=1 Tax=Falsiroseomonas frigidaquae TaxID=487318 RepID=UPI001558C62D|nr:TIGR04283 family arsenosugar biosynthesis glycosyltransferase [Falsiroseomonas frigidaquae]